MDKKIMAIGGLVAVGTIAYFLFGNTSSDDTLTGGGGQGSGGG